MENSARNVMVTSIPRMVMSVVHVQICSITVTSAMKVLAFSTVVHTVRTDSMAATAAMILLALGAAAHTTTSIQMLRDVSTQRKLSARRSSTSTTRPSTATTAQMWYPVASSVTSIKTLTSTARGVSQVITRRSMVSV
jgi:hypothetical protein